METIAVIGAGTMGIGVTIDLVLNNYAVILVDHDNDQLEKARNEIGKNVRFAPMLKKGAPRMTPEQAWEKVTFTTAITEITNADFVVENIAEKWEAKAPLYTQMDKLCREEIIFGADTSCMSITRLGSLTSRPDKVIGIHFMNPVFLKSAVEVIQGMHTSDETLQKVDSFLETLGKESIVVQDLPGFVSNRISHLFMNEAAWVLMDGVADAKAVDEIFKKCYGHTMGPLETADLIGLDTVVDSLDVLYQSYQDPKYRVCPLLKKMVDGGLLGKKSGKGFFEY